MTINDNTIFTIEVRVVTQDKAIVDQVEKHVVNAAKALAVGRDWVDMQVACYSHNYRDGHTDLDTDLI